MKALLTIIFIVFFIISCEDKTQEVKENVTKEEVEVKKQPVYVDVVTKSPISSYLVSSGIIQARKSIEVFPKVAGYVAEVFIHNGQYVETKETLVRLDPQEWEIAVKQAEMEILELREREKQQNFTIVSLQKKIKQADLTVLELLEQMKQIKLDQEKAKKDLSRSIESYQKNIISEGELETNRYNYQKSMLSENALKVQMDRAAVTKEEAELELAKAEIDLENIKIGMKRANETTLKDAKLKLSYATVIAPFAGTIIDKAVVEGQLVNTGAKIFTLIDLKNLQLILNIPEKELRILKKKQKVLLSSENFPDLSATGIVTAISPVVDQATGTVSVIVTVDDNQSLLRPGIFVQAAIVTETKSDAVTIPRAPILYERGKPIVFVVNEKGIAEKRSIEMGIREGDIVEIYSGISAGEKLIVSGHHIVENQQEVEIMEPKKELENN